MKDVIELEKKMTVECSGFLSEERAVQKANGSSQLPNVEVIPFISQSGSVSSATTVGRPSPPTSKSTNGTTTAISEAEEEKAKKLLYCSLCKVAVNSLSQLEAHNTGKYLPEITKCVTVFLRVGGTALDTCWHLVTVVCVSICLQCFTEKEGTFYLPYTTAITIVLPEDNTGSINSAVY